MNKKQVLFIIGNGAIGGREKMLFQSVKQLVKEQKFLPSVVFLNAKGYYYDKIKELDITVFYLGKTKALKIFKLRNIISQYSIVVFFTFSISIFISSIKTKSKKIFNLHGRLYANPINKTKRQNSNIKTPAFRKKKSLNLINLLYNFLRRIIKYQAARIFLNKSDSIIVASNYLKNYVMQNFKINDAQIKVVPNFIDLNEIKISVKKEEILKELKIPEESFIVGYAGRFEKRKGLQRLLNAFQIIIEEKLISEAYLLLVGEGSAEEEMMVEYAKKNNLLDRVKITGFKSDIYNYINVMNAFVLPSYDENFGLSLIEALALGKPSFIFKDSGGPTEIITNFQNGFVVEDEKELAKKIYIVKEDLILNKNISLSARKFSEKYDCQKVIPQYLEALSIL